ncbi:catechol 2,3-dioxygenase-like lactoylglutathione lyase family enzyme [Salegentibacter sp. 24]|uniref:VOC family protein n=1 Tax=Salegentibacter sp. 24 TaxID=2183986 RepID=UPI0010621FC9|nr:VOC family protein [Salegentibacter sp. 24]TDN81579.1 catechol 2,3-dioxygenase-like lactoylglutathione lyase family enzyme [Salegentibacter sp. 24]
MKTNNLSAVILFAATSASGDFNFRKDHDTIRVKDLKASVYFYGTILGLKQIPNGGLGNHIKWFQLNNKVQLHLVESDEVVEKKKGVHTAFNTDNLSEFMDFMKSKNIPFENGKGDKDSVTKRPDGIRQIYFQDPDGYWIEVNDSKV